MEPKPLINVVVVQTQPGYEEKFTTWLHDVHIPLLLQFKGLRKIASYKKTSGSQDQPAEFMSIYEFESPEAFRRYESSPELIASREEMAESWGNPPAGFTVLRREQYEKEQSWNE